jgi:hypothetical protein
MLWRLYMVTLWYLHCKMLYDNVYCRLVPALYRCFMMTSIGVFVPVCMMSVIDILFPTLHRCLYGDIYRCVSPCAVLMFMWGLLLICWYLCCLDVCVTKFIVMLVPDHIGVNWYVGSFALLLFVWRCFLIFWFRQFIDNCMITFTDILVPVLYI